VDDAGANLEGRLAGTYVNRLRARLRSVSWGWVMQTNSDRQTTFGDLTCGHAFRFYFRGEAAIGLKAFIPGGDEAALVLTDTKSGLRPGDLLSAYDVGLSDIVALTDVSLTPSRDSATPGRGNFAESGEIELQNSGLTFVTQLQAGRRLRVDLTSGAIGQGTSVPPVEIYSKWSVVQTVGGLSETLYAYEPAPAEDVIVAVDI
jgi:hypothetical protein